MEKALLDSKTVKGALIAGFGGFVWSVLNYYGYTVPVGEVITILGSVLMAIGFRDALE